MRERHVTPVMNAARMTPIGSSKAMAPGHVVSGRYEVGDIIGEGVSGIVYLARAVAGDGPSTVALKVIHRHLLKNRQIRGRFHREAQLLRRLEGPNLVKLFDFGEADDGLLYMALELVQGHALDQLIPRHGFAHEEAVPILRQVCSALEAAHEAGIVHRDLKPGNVILSSRDDGSWHVRVLDFGMAKMLRGDASDSITALTEQNMVFGTPEYMAPEQARGDEVDARCDVYAAGVMLYELLTGRPPFSGTTPIGVMTAHLVDEPTPPSSRSPAARIPPALEAVVLHALAKRPEHRYPSARALSSALERAVERPDDPASAAPPPLDDMAHRDTALDLSRHRDRSLPAPAHSRSTDRTWLVVGVVAAILGIGAGVVLSLVGG